MQSKPEACYMSPTQAAWRTSLHAEWEPSPGCFGLESGTNWYYSFHGIQNSSKAHRTCKTCKHNAITLRCGKPEPNRPFLPSCSSKRKITWKNIPRCIIFGALLGIHLWPSKTPRLVGFLHGDRKWWPGEPLLLGHWGGIALGDLWEVGKRIWKGTYCHIANIAMQPNQKHQWMAFFLMRLAFM